MRWWLSIAALLAAPLAARDIPPARGLRLDRVVLVMRHGVRPPTKTPPMPAGVASDPWPVWPVPPGYLTPHGAQAVVLVARADRARWQGAGLLPPVGCPRVRIVADSDQRTIATGDAYARALAPGCAVAMEHKPQDVPDPLFAPIAERATEYDPAIARAAVLAAAGPDGITREEARLRPQLARLDAILCGNSTAVCGVGRAPSAVAPTTPGSRPKLTGALDLGSTAGQILLLQYADGKPMAEVGWGRASAADIAMLSELHAVEFRLLARPRYVAKANLALLAPLILEALTQADASAVTMIAGHDTNVASLAGLLGLHWHVPGFAADDPSPGGAIVLERWRDRRGTPYVRARYRSQTLAQIRTLADASPYQVVVPIARCTALGVRGLCTLAQLRSQLTR